MAVDPRWRLHLNYLINYESPEMPYIYSPFRSLKFKYSYISQPDKRTLKKKKIEAATTSCEEDEGGDTDILTGSSSSSENSDPAMIAESSNTEKGVYADGNYI